MGYPFPRKTDKTWAHKVLKEYVPLTKMNENYLFLSFIPSVYVVEESNSH